MEQEPYLGQSIVKKSVPDQINFSILLASMKREDIRRHLKKEYSIVQSRRSTINHSFASALSIADVPDDGEIIHALHILGQDPDGELQCAYCGEKAETWDHVSALVKNGEYSGHGHQLNNLLPCCKGCNSSKGNKHWESFLTSKGTNTPERVARIRAYVNMGVANTWQRMQEYCAVELDELRQIKEQVLKLLGEADAKADAIRRKTRELNKS